MDGPKGGSGVKPHAGGAPEVGEAGLGMRDPTHPPSVFLRKE